MLDLVESLGFGLERTPDARQRLNRYIALKLAANGLSRPEVPGTSPQSEDAERLFSYYYQRLKRLDDVRCASDARIESFLTAHLAGVELSAPPRLPQRSVILDRYGLAREMSLPLGHDSYTNPYVSSYRVRNGVLHNPVNDRRTTSGTFHVTEGGLPVPRDKKAVPQKTFAELLRRAVNPPDEVLELPFSADCAEPARTFVSMMIRPLVCPAVPGITPEKRMEIRFFAPGSLVSNLDFVESIFGNAGDPFLPENDAALDVEHWTGHTGCVILAPHLTQVTKREAGLPHRDHATPRQIEDGMCWESPDELYNGGEAFKLTCRTEEGVIVTLIADNYYGYCKKEVKTQISYAANLYGNVEEEHAGGTIAFCSFNLGEEFNAAARHRSTRRLADVERDYGGKLIDIHPEGYGTDRTHPEVVYIPENAIATVQGQKITWKNATGEHSIPLLPEKVYLTPWGYKLRLEKHPTAPSWRLIGTLPEGVVCHKPCTVSGGGKSEISKSVVDYILYGPIFVADIEKDLAKVDEIFQKDYSDRWRVDASVQPDYTSRSSRKLLDPSRSLGSVIKLLTPSIDYRDEYNQWLESIPDYLYALVFIIKRFHRGDASSDWRSNYSVDIANGTPGHELKYRDRKLVGDYLRVGLLGDKTWRTWKLRQDFAPADKVQTEDDISASIVIPAGQLDWLGEDLEPAHSYKFVENCEFRLFQRPDDAIHRGLDKQCEADMSRDDNFIVNFEPLSREQVQEICERAVDFSQFTPPMQQLMREVQSGTDRFVVCSATPRMIDGQPSKNPRYLQNRPDLMVPLKRYVSEMGTRLYRAVPADSPVRMPVHGVLFGRRNNPPDYARGFRPLAVYNPLHYQELPELFMDFVSSLTGKSPSTTGAGSEGALTKGPFNALLPITDLNNALVSYLLTGLAGFSTAAGHIGPDIRVDHDISLLIPEIWCRLSWQERSPELLLREELLDQLEDFEHKGRLIPASRLGYRINSRFVRRFVGRVFDNPNKVFDDTLLRPETQDRDAFADGVLYIAEAHERVSKLYFEDGSAEQACPPLRALLHIMAFGDCDGMTLNTAEFRQLFTRSNLLASDWYQQRLRTKQQRDVKLWARHVQSLEQFLAAPEYQREASELKIASRLHSAREELQRMQSPEYLRDLSGCLGADPMSFVMSR